MAKGYVYIMTTAVDGIIKIGKSDNWNRRCQSELETNGYRNMNGLKTYFVVECSDYSEIENIMHDIFRESRVIGAKDSKTELFAVDKDRAKRVLSRMGTQVFPITNLQPISNDKSTNVHCNFKDLNIPVGSVLTCDKFGGLLVTVADDKNKVKLPTGEIVTITQAEKTINPNARDGFYVFKYNNVTIRNMWKNRNNTGK